MGILITVSGLISGYFYFIYNINLADSSIMLLVSALILVIIGLFFINKTFALYMGLDSIPDNQPKKSFWFENGTEHPIESTLEKNEELIKDWTKTNKTRDELKLLEAAASIQEPKRKF